MQFNNRITVIYNSVNEFSEEQTVSESAMRCCIIEHERQIQKTEGAKSKRYDLKFIASNRAYAPYKDLFDQSEMILFRYGGITYEPIVVAAINDFSGKVKYYEVDLREKK